MASSTRTVAGQQVLDGSNPAVGRLRQLMGGSDPKDGWSRCWEEGVTPWDLGRATPAVVELVKSGTLPAGDAATVLVPGCGAVEGQEAGPPFNTTVLDYEVVLNPLGFVMNSIQDNEVAVEPRKGREKIARWKRTAQPVECLHSED